MKTLAAGVRNLALACTMLDVLVNAGYGAVGDYNAICIISCNEGHRPFGAFFAAIGNNYGKIPPILRCFSSPKMDLGIVS
jgi:hypothetical protein